MHQEEPSLLTHIEHIRSKHLPEGGLSTVIFCGKVRGESDLPNVLQMHREIVEKEVNQEQVNVTGILMGQGNSVLHLLEGPSFSILRILNNLSNHQHFTTESIQSGNIVFNIEDRPKRFFPEWYSCIIQERKSQSEDISEDTFNDVVYDMATRLLDVGNGLQSEDQDDLDLSSYAEQLPGKNLILALASSSFCFSLEEYVECYYDPYHVELESEQTWPLERLVNY